MYEHAEMTLLVDVNGHIASFKGPSIKGLSLIMVDTFQLLHEGFWLISDKQVNNAIHKLKVLQC